MMKLRFLGALSLCLMGLSGCAVSASSSKTPAEPPPAPAKSDAQAKADAKAKAEAQAKAEAKAKAPAAASLVFALEGAGLARPEAVVYDAEQDVYFVSNVNGDPLKKDGNGFVSKVSADGRVLELKFIDGASSKTKLDAPKGMAISGDLLYVADISWVRIFDRKSGAPRGRLFAKGATFLNAVAVLEDAVFLTDTGWKSGKEGFDNTGSDSILRINPKKVIVESVLADKSLGNPNGIVSTKEGLFVVSAGGELYPLKLEQKGKATVGVKGAPTKLPAGFLDGVVGLEDGTFLVSSWAGKAVYHGKPGGKFSTVITGLPSPAAIGFDTKRKRLLIPSMMEDRVLCYELSLQEGSEPAVAPQPGAGKAAAGPAPGPAAPPAAAGAAAAPAKPNAKSQGQAATPANPAQPASKATPAQPAQPAKPAKSGKPASKAAPAQPAQPAQPGKPASKATPEKPTKPAKAAAAAKSASPAKPAKPAKAAEPAKSAAPVKKK